MRTGHDGIGRTVWLMLPMHWLGLSDLMSLFSRGSPDPYTGSYRRHLELGGGSPPKDMEFDSDVSSKKR